MEWSTGILIEVTRNTRIQRCSQTIIIWP